MTNKTTPSPQRYARAGGLAYLIIIITGALGELFIRNKMIVPGDAAATMHNIAASPGLWRLGIGGDLLMHICDLVLAVVYYSLFKRVNRTLALLSLFFGLVQTSVLVANKLNLVMPLLLTGDADYLKAFDPQQLQALAYAAIRMHGYGFSIGLIFFGCSCLLDGYLVVKSGFLPKALGVLLFIAGLCYLTNSVALLLFPGVADSILSVILTPVFIAELSMSLWLLFKGVNVARWKAWDTSD